MKNKSKVSMAYIHRHGQYRGWQVRFTTLPRWIKKKEVSACFAFSKYGSGNKALAAAIIYRDTIKDILSK